VSRIRRREGKVGFGGGREGRREGGGAASVSVCILLNGRRKAQTDLFFSPSSLPPVTRAHLEARLSSSILLDDKKECTYLLKLLVSRLLASHDATRLRALCDRLLGRRGNSSSSGSSSSGSEGGREGGLAWWRPERRELVSGLSKRQALKRVVLPSMVGKEGAPAAVQRVAKFFVEALEREGEGGR